MMIKVERIYQGGTLVVIDVPADDQGRISVEDDAVIAQYISFLTKKTSSEKSKSRFLKSR